MGWREAQARERCTKTDWALEVAELPEGRKAGCKKMTLMLDHLNTDTMGAFDQAVEPIRPRDVVRRIELCDTP